MKPAEVIEKPINVEVIPRRVNPAIVEKLQADVVALEKDVGAKQKVIDKLRTDVDSQEQRISGLEGLNP